MDVVNKVRERLIVASVFHCERINLKLTPMTFNQSLSGSGGNSCSQPSRWGFGLVSDQTRDAPAALSAEAQQDS